MKIKDLDRVWFSSDPHFFHTNILKYEPIIRGNKFPNIDEMNEYIIDRHNFVVKPMDTWVSVGDFVFGSNNIGKIMPRLNGKSILIGGNHDQKMEDYIKYFHKVFFYSSVTVNYDNEDVKILISHIPCHYNQLQYRYNINIHGHLHSNELEPRLLPNGKKNNWYSKYFCVSMEQLSDFIPISLRNILEILKRRENNE